LHTTRSETGSAPRIAPIATHAPANRFTSSRHATFAWITAQEGLSSRTTHSFPDSQHNPAFSGNTLPLDGLH